jgi:hypothetical protein
MLEAVWPSEDNEAASEVAAGDAFNSTCQEIVVFVFFPLRRRTERWRAQHSDQIWRIFAQWAIVCSLWAVFLKIAEEAIIFGATFSPTVKVMYFFRRKCIGLRFGRFFSQAHLVTLARNKSVLQHILI